MRHVTKCQLSYIQQYSINTYGVPKSQYYCPNVKRARNGEPIKTGTDGILNFDQSKMLFPVMCHLMYIDTTIFTKISDYATAVFSVHSMMRPLKCT